MNNWTYVVGWTLIHFIWEGAVLALLGAAVLQLCRHCSANTRYATACAALAAMLVAPVVTACVMLAPSIAPVPVASLPDVVGATGIVSTTIHSWAHDITYSGR